MARKVRVGVSLFCPCDSLPTMLLLGKRKLAQANPYDSQRIDVLTTALSPRFCVAWAYSGPEDLFVPVNSVCPTKVDLL